MEIRRNPLKRYYGSGDLHFVTFSCYRRRPYLGTARARNRFVRILQEVRIRHEFELIGYVVMPEHVHLLIGEPAKGNPSRVLQVLKQKVSRALRRTQVRPTKQMVFRFDDQEEESKAFWQRRFYDFNVWGEKKLKQKLEYMHRNPVDRKLVKHPRDWLWSSWRFYEGNGKGLIPIDSTREREKQNQNPHP